ncbi:RNA polymerase sigma factor [Anseongella ginsenosidimutans]|nr:sigma-70 family RNA polymerase sigma factor [Anseongella ginsenosidimutans]
MLRNGDKQAFALIYNRFFPRLFNYGMKLIPQAELIRDGIHDVFVTLWKSRQRLSATSSVKFYLYACLKRRIIALSRQNRLLPVKRLFGFPGEFEFCLSPEDSIILEQTGQIKRQKLQELINKLSRRQKEALFLRYYEGLSPKEVAAIMSLNINSTYVLLSKALDFLRTHRDKLLPAAFLFFFK